MLKGVGCTPVPGEFSLNGDELEDTRTRGQGQDQDQDQDQHVRQTGTDSNNNNNNTSVPCNECGDQRRRDHRSPPTSLDR